MLLNTPAGTPTFRTTNLQMARLTDEESRPVKELSEGGERTAGALPKEDFKIEYVHAVTGAQTNPQTGQQEPS